MRFETCLAEQAALHPALGPQDAVKLCYQAAFGAEHLLSDREDAARQLALELADVCPSPGPLREPISPRYARVNLSVWKKKGLPGETLFRLFCRCAAGPLPESAGELFRQYLKAAETAARAGQLPFSVSAWQEYLAGYFAQGGGAVHHSPRYREAEQPHYRVVRLRDLEKISIAEALDKDS